MAGVIELKTASTVGAVTGDGLAAVRDLRLQAMTQSARAAKLDHYESYFRATQYVHRQYDWDGRRQGYGSVADISPGYYIPLAQRRPSCQIDLARQVVRRFSSLVFGHGRWPEINVDGDDDAQDYVRELAKQSRLQAKMVEARNLGGAEGTVALSFAFIEGKPRVAVHNAKTMFVLAWADRDELRPQAVLETYSYTKYLYETGSNEAKAKTFYYARLWTAEQETIWDPIPKSVAEDGSWPAVPHKTVRHDFGFCPVYWIQNNPCSQDIDGDSDYEGLPGLFDEMSAVASQTTKGVKANTDPTLIIKEKRTQNGGQIRKGSENAIWAEGGADYLTLDPGAIDAAEKWLNRLHREGEESAQVVLPDPEKLAGKAQSAAAVRILYMPMLSQCDILRDQYGAGGLVEILKGMLHAARNFEGQGDGGPIKLTSDGRRIQENPVVKLPPKYEERDGTKFKVERVPGESSEITLNWPPYFPDTWADIKLAVDAAVAATGKKAVLSQETAVKTIAPKFGNFNTDEELERMEEDQDKALEIAAQTGPQDTISGNELYGGQGAEEPQPKPSEGG